MKQGDPQSRRARRAGRAISRSCSSSCLVPETHSKDRSDDHLAHSKSDRRSMLTVGSRGRRRFVFHRATVRNRCTAAPHKAVSSHQTKAFGIPLGVRERRFALRGFTGNEVRLPPAQKMRTRNGPSRPVSSFRPSPIHTTVLPRVETSRVVFVARANCGHSGLPCNRPARASRSARRASR